MAGYKLPNKIDNLGDYGKDYSDESFWDKIMSILGKVGGEVLEKALLLYYVLQSPETPGWAKTLIVGALGYLILPVDIIPDFVPVLGYSDDLVALGGALKSVSDYATPDVKAKAAKRKELMG